MSVAAVSSDPAGGPPRTGRRVRRAAAGLLLACLFVLLGATGLAALGCDDDDADPFEGVYWEPSSARRIEIRRDGDAYWFYYGVDKQPYRAEREGDELAIAEPMGGEIVVRPGEDEGTLELLSGDTISRLEPLPEGD